MCSADELRLMRKALEILSDDSVAAMSRDERTVYLSSMITAAYQIMRRVEGDEFVRDFLQSALDTLDRPRPRAALRLV
jgi:hypothetical protein